jgi:hypothetical protein
MRHLAFALVLTFCMEPLRGATLERLSLEDMIAQSTSIVRGKVNASSTQFHGPVIYTHYKIQVAERYKGANSSEAEIIVPGGSVNGVRQDVAGAPQLNAGDTYVLFLWKGNSGWTHIIGLTQGLFQVGDGDDPAAVRIPSAELMLDRATGHAVKEDRLSLRLSELKARIGNSKHGAGK